jgi:hypothetical protein
VTGPNNGAAPNNSRELWYIIWVLLFSDASGRLYSFLMHLHHDHSMKAEGIKMQRL